jgi:hypothetical protein
MLCSNDEVKMKIKVWLRVMLTTGSWFRLHVYDTALLFLKIANPPLTLLQIIQSSFSQSVLHGSQEIRDHFLGIRGYISLTDTLQFAYYFK